MQIWANAILHFLLVRQSRIGAIPLFRQHLFDIVNEPRMMSVAEYRDQVMTIIDDIWTRNNIPILVGGSGFYLQSYFSPQAPVYQKKVITIMALNQNAGICYIPLIQNEHYAFIKMIFIALIVRSIYFIQRAKSHQSRYHAINHLDHFVSFFDRDRDDLYNRINARTQIMLQDGWIKEVERLQGTSWEPFLKTKKLIGYDDILKYLDVRETSGDFQELIAVISQKTRQYANGK